MYLGSSIPKKKIKLVQLADLIINDLNIKRNDILMVYASLHKIDLVDSRPEDLIHLLKMIVGTQGALLMPTFSERQYHILKPELPNNIFKVSINCTLLSESFQQMPDTIQNRNPLESFAAWGGMAKKITEDQFNSGNNIDKNNLLYKLSRLKGKIIGLGVPFKDLSVLLKFVNAFDNNPIKEEKYTKCDKYHVYDIIKSKSHEEKSELFEESDLYAFEKRGIPFFRLNSKKICN